MLLAVLVAAVGASVAVSTLAPEPAEEGRLHVVATFYPLAFLAAEIGGNRAAVQSLVPENADLHGWEPSTGDLLAVAEADLFIYNGAGLEPWVERDLLPILPSDGVVVVEATSAVADSLISFRDPGPPENGEGAGPTPEHADPHTWIDPVLARAEAEAILVGFQTADPARAALYEANAGSLLNRLGSISANYAEGLAPLDHEIIIVAHDAFGYLGYRYGFEVIGIIGLGADEQPSTAHLAGIVEAMVQQQIYTLFITPVFSDEYVLALRATLEAETGREVTLQTLYLLTGVEGDLDFLDQMERNLVGLQAGLFETEGP